MDTSNLKIALLVNFIPPYRVSFYKHLAKKMAELRIFVSAKTEINRTWISNWGDLNVDIQKNIVITHKWKHSIGFNDSIFIHLPYDTIPKLMRYKPDIIVSGELGFRSVQAIMYCRWFRRKVFVLWATLSEHTEKNRGILRFILRKYLLHKADIVIVNGASGKRYIKKFGVQNENIIILPYTTDIAHSLSDRESTDSRRLIYVGQLIARKGVDKFLRYLIEWANQNSHVKIEQWIVGEGDQRKSLEGLFFPVNLKVRFFGSVAYSEIAKYYSNCDILVFPSLADEWGLVVNEAMISGLPVLGSIYSQAVEELVVEEKTGWQFRPDDRESSIQAIEKALTTPINTLISMGKNAMLAVEKMTPEIVANKFVSELNIKLLSINFSKINVKEA